MSQILIKFKSNP